MTFQKNAFVIKFVILTVAFTEVASWTIDLPEVRKFLFEKNEKYKIYNKNEYEDYLNSDQKFYSNIEGNSKHHSEDYKHDHHQETEKYADEYGYHTSYMEKKVSIYLISTRCVRSAKEICSQARTLETILYC